MGVVHLRISTGGVKKATLDTREDEMGGRRGTADQDSSQLAYFDILVLSQLAPKAFLGSTKQENQAEMGSMKRAV